MLRSPGEPGTRQTSLARSGSAQGWSMSPWNSWRTTAESSENSKLARGLAEGRTGHEVSEGTAMNGCRGQHPEEERPATSVGLLCGNCYDRLRRQLRMLPAVAEWLRVNLAAGSGQLRDKVSGSSEDPIPLRLNVLDLVGPNSPLPVLLDREGRESIRAVLVRYAEMVRQGGSSYPSSTVVFLDGRPLGEYHSFSAAAEDCDRARWDSRRQTDPRRWTLCNVPAREGWPARAGLPEVARWLTDHLHWITVQPWCGELAGDLGRVMSAAHQSTPWREEIRRDTEPCRRCGKATVVLHIAQGVSRCERKAGGCGRSEPLSEYVMNALLPETRR